MLLSVGNVVAHAILFNFKGKTFYNAGLTTSLLLFMPCAYFFFLIIHKNNRATKTDYCVGIIVGVILNVVGILKLINWMADKDTNYIFSKRNLLAKVRH